MTTSSGLVSSSTRGRSSVVPCTRWPDTSMPCLRGSSSMKPITALESSGLRRSSSATCWPPLPAPTISTSVSARCTSGWRSGRSTAARTRKRAPATKRQREQEVQRDHAARRVGVRGREQEQQPDQHEARDHDRLDDRLEVRLVDEPPQLRVQAEGGEQRQLDRHHERDGAGEQVLVAARDAGVEAQHERQVVGERDQAGVDPHLSEAARVYRRCDPGVSLFCGREQQFRQFARIAPDPVGLVQRALLDAAPDRDPRACAGGRRGAAARRRRPGDPRRW